MAEQPSFSRYAPEDLESDKPAEDIWIEEDCETCDSESDSHHDDYHSYLSDGALNTANLNEELTLVEALAQFIVEILVNCKDDKQSQTPLVASAMDDVLPETLPRPLSTIPFRRDDTTSQTLSVSPQKALQENSSAVVPSSEHQRTLHQLRREDYTVRWICALPVELTAVQELLDEEHSDLERDLDDYDENLYTLARSIA
jgi:hypothetical protein